jgi:hypothetical protein
VLRLHDFECPECGVWEALIDDDRRTTFCGCGLEATRIISAPAIHTLETHMRGYQAHSAEEQWAPGHGGFRDVNLTDKAGNPQVYSSLAEKNALLKKHGLAVKEPNKDRFRKRKSQRSMVFDGSSNRKSQLGIN